MHKFVRELITEWRKLGLPFEGETLVLGVSGGADSVSMLLAVADLARRGKLRHRIVAAHFDHGLRGKSSSADAEFVRSLCSELEVEFFLVRGRVLRKGNLEQNARRARYKFLADASTKFDAKFVLTAHTINDQAETFLINLLRGSGVEGLSAMPKVRALDGSHADLVRPLLGWARREDTEAYSRERGVEFREDAMNRDDAFTRVRVRFELIPLLRTFNPSIVDSLARTAGLVAEFSSQIPDASADAPTDELSLRQLREMSTGDLRSTLRSWLKQRRGDLRGLGHKHFSALEQLIISRKSGKIVELPGKGIVVKGGGKLCYETIKVEK